MRSVLSSSAVALSWVLDFAGLDRRQFPLNALYWASPRELQRLQEILGFWAACQSLCTWLKRVTCVSLVPLKRDWPSPSTPNTQMLSYLSPLQPQARATELSMKTSSAEDLYATLPWTKAASSGSVSVLPAWRQGVCQHGRIYSSRIRESQSEITANVQGPGLLNSIRSTGFSFLRERDNKCDLHAVLLNIYHLTWEYSDITGYMKRRKLLNWHEYFELVVLIFYAGDQNQSLTHARQGLHSWA
jgi:hypothetical protein